MSNGDWKGLKKVLEGILGSKEVYFQPPSNIHMKYPAIIFEREDIQNTFADNLVYKQDTAYKVTVMDKNPNSEIVKEVSLIPTARYVQFFVTNNLNHDIFIIFY